MKKVLLILALVLAFTQPTSVKADIGVVVETDLPQFKLIMRVHFSPKQCATLLHFQPKEADLSRLAFPEEVQVEGFKF